MLIRRETPADLAAIADVVADAFRDGAAPGGAPVEVHLLELLRAGPDWLPELALVAESTTGEVIGQVTGSRAWVARTEAVGLGPLAVRPAQQGRGVGSALVHAVLGAAQALGAPLVGLLGSTTFYSRFGFCPASGVHIDAPDPAWGDHFQVRLFVPENAAPRGRFRYSAAFDDAGSA